MALTAPPPAFFSKTYDEAFGLLVAARDYLAEREAAECAALDPLARLSVSCETMRLTTRLTRMMAWLLMQRAVYAGEMARTEALADPDPLTQNSLCMENDGKAALPSELRRLLERSQRLYIRVARLDQLARRRAV